VGPYDSRPRREGEPAQCAAPPIAVQGIGVGSSDLDGATRPQQTPHPMRRAGAIQRYHTKVRTRSTHVKSFTKREVKVEHGGMHDGTAYP
jgi:hypothetical protein